MIPIGDDNPTLRFPLVTILLLAALGAIWVLVQGAGFDPHTLADSVCNWGMIPGALTGQARAGLEVPVGNGYACVLQTQDPRNYLTPLTSMFMHGSWLHILGNGLFLWIFGNNVEDSMGRMRFLVFYLLCGFAAAALQVAVDPSSPVPMVGASGAIAGVLGAYLMLYPRVRVKVLFIWIIFIQVISLPAYLVLLWWIALQILAALPQLSPMKREISSGVAVFAHIGGFAAGFALVRLFVNKNLVAARTHGGGGRAVPRAPWN